MAGDEKYRLTLEGSDIDEALLRLANYEDEGIVLGSRKGVMLGPESEYYHKNARYYAELAQSAVPGDTTSAVRWDIDQSALTDADREMARKNIRAGGSNPNLLDNPFFTVNQRSVSGAVGVGGYVADRSYVRSGTGVSVTHKANGGITITNTTNFDITYLFPFKNTGELNGKTVTLSSNVNGDIVSATGVIGSTNGYYVSCANNGLDIRCGSYSTIKSGLLFINVSNQTAGAQLNVDLNAVKLEIGSVSTLANDASPNYAEELAKCNFYDTMLKTSTQYGYVGYGIADSATSATILIPLPNNMRDATPTITTNGTIAVKGGTSGTHTMTGITFKLRVTGVVLVTVATTGLTTGEFCLLQLNNTSSYINLSADL